MMHVELLQTLDVLRTQTLHERKQVLTVVDLLLLLWLLLRLLLLLLLLWLLLWLLWRCWLRGQIL